MKSSYFVFCEGTENSSERISDNFKEVYSKTKDFRKIGSAALEICWIATGRAEGYVIYGIPIWDIASGILILSEAGGSLHDFHKKIMGWNDFRIDKDHNLIASNGNIPLSFRIK